MVCIQCAKGDKQRQPIYEDLLKVTRKVICHTRSAEGALKQLSCVNIGLLTLLLDIKHYADLSEQVYDQTYRRVVQG